MFLDLFFSDEYDLFTPTFDDKPNASLEAFRVHWCNASINQTIHIDRQSPKLLREIFTLYKRGLNVRAMPDVQFKGEDGSDASGPTREYFHLSMSHLATGDSQIHLFEGEKDHLMPIHCIESFDSMLFYYSGLMISHSFLHEGYPLIGMSQAVVAYIVTDSIDEAVPFLTIKDIPDLEVRDILQQVSIKNYYVFIYYLQTGFANCGIVLRTQ